MRAALALALAFAGCASAPDWARDLELRAGADRRCQTGAAFGLADRDAAHAAATRDSIRRLLLSTGTASAAQALAVEQRSEGRVTFWRADAPDDKREAELGRQHLAVARWTELGYLLHDAYVETCVLSVDYDALGALLIGAPQRQRAELEARLVEIERALDGRQLADAAFGLRALAGLVLAPELGQRKDALAARLSAGVTLRWASPPVARPDGSELGVIASFEGVPLVDPPLECTIDGGSCARAGSAKLRVQSAADGEVRFLVAGVEQRLPLYVLPAEGLIVCGPRAELAAALTAILRTARLPAVASELCAHREISDELRLVVRLATAKPVCRPTKTGARCAIMLGAELVDHVAGGKPERIVVKRDGDGGDETAAIEAGTEAARAELGVRLAERLRALLD